MRRLYTQGHDAWVRDPVAADLMEYTSQKYAGLAIKHGLDPWEAASAAFDVMRTRAAREARDPWAVITHAVRITCIYEERAQSLLCSVHQARRPHIFALPDPERFSDRAFPWADDHPVLAATDDGLARLTVSGPEDATMSARAAVEDAIELFALLGWPFDTARSGVEHVCDALTRAGSRHTAFEALRRDRHARALLDIPSAAWHVLLRTLLGRPEPAYAATTAGRGILLRLLIGETVPLLLCDDDLVEALSLVAPGAGR
ncbi:hypothetical protein [Nesterenkonia ebinurensis]|uniref:hypothetical protein n=1 Tax=Nesterenkonia ebinurensis TaxID=2608252 RepID=UPI00295F12D7|nr:hypothetical protein [Nesterenkonia ebinurensis]